MDCEIVSTVVIDIHGVHARLVRCGIARVGVPCRPPQFHLHAQALPAELGERVTFPAHRAIQTVRADNPPVCKAWERVLQNSGRGVSSGVCLSGVWSLGVTFRLCSALFIRLTGHQADCDKAQVKRVVMRRMTSAASV